jgi:hypothetical protein
LIEMFTAAVPGGHVVFTRLPYDDRVPDSPEGACSTAAVVMAWVCVGFVSVIAALAQSVVWTIVALLALVLTIACTLAGADRVPFRADSAPSTGVGEDDERVGSW